MLRVVSEAYRKAPDSVFSVLSISSGLTAPGRVLSLDYCSLDCYCRILPNGPALAARICWYDGYGGTWFQVLPLLSVGSAFEFHQQEECSCSANVDTASVNVFETLWNGQIPRPLSNFFEPQIRERKNTHFSHVSKTLPKMRFPQILKGDGDFARATFCNLKKNRCFKNVSYGCIHAGSIFRCKLPSARGGTRPTLLLMFQLLLNI